MERWKINLYTVWFSQILSIMSFSFGMPFIPFFIQQDLGVVQPDSIKIYTGLLSLAPAVTMAIMAPIWGIVADRFGKKLMLLRAMLFASVIIGSMGVVANVDQLLVLRFIQGIFTGTVTASAALVASSVPSNRLSYALGFMSSSTFIGASAGPIIGGFMADLVGYRASFFLGGVLMLIDFVIVLSLVKEEKTQPLAKEDKPESSSPFSFFSMIIMSVLLLIVILRISRSVFGPYLPLYVQELLANSKSAVKVTGLINGVTGLATALAGLTLSRLGDRYDKMKLLMVMFAASIASSLLVPSVAGNLWLFVAAYGIFFFIMGGVEPVLISISAEKTPAGRRGVLFGLQGTVGNLGLAISPVIGGAVSLGYSLRTILLMVPFTLLPGLLLLFLLKKEVGKAARMSQSTGVEEVG